MIRQQTGTRINIALTLATLADITSIEHPAAPRGLTYFLPRTSAPEAAAAAGTIGENPGAVTPP